MYLRMQHLLDLLPVGGSQSRGRVWGTAAGNVGHIVEDYPLVLLRLAVKIEASVLNSLHQTLMTSADLVQSTGCPTSKSECKASMMCSPALLQAGTRSR